VIAQAGIILSVRKDIVTANIENLTDEYLTRLKETVNAPNNPIIYLAIDPGAANGVCGYDVKCYPQFMHTVASEDMVKYLEIFTEVKKCILEDFLLYPDKAKHQTYSDMVTSRVIGRVEAWAERREVEVVKQGAKIKKTGYMWIGEKPLPKSNSKNHVMDAHVHFIYWAVRKGLISASSLLKINHPNV
jgi:hypothetical protein